MGEELGEVAAEVSVTRESDVPTIYYHGERRCRSLWSFFVMSIVGFLALSFIGSLITFPRWIERGLGTVVAIAFAYFALPVLMRFACNDVDAFEIRSDGISRRGRLIPWQQIRQLGAFGKPEQKSVSLFYSKWSWRSVPPLLRELPEDRRVSPEEIERLSLRLRSELSARYPELAIGHYLDFSD